MWGQIVPIFILKIIGEKFGSLNYSFYLYGIKLKDMTKLNDFGNVQNFWMSNNNSSPEVGEGVTFINYTDRYVGMVTAVNGKEIEVQMYEAKAKPGSVMGHQDWDLIPSRHFRTLKFRYGNWYEKFHLYDDVFDYSKVNVLFGQMDYYYDWSF